MSKKLSDNFSRAWLVVFADKRLRTLMDSQRFHQATGLNGCHHDRSDARNLVDLTLKLGLGNHAGRSHRINLIDLFNTPAPMTAPDLANFNFNAGSNTSANKVYHSILITNDAAFLRLYGCKKRGRICVCATYIKIGIRSFDLFIIWSDQLHIRNKMCNLYSRNMYFIS